jgi:hypothetical protein
MVLVFDHLQFSKDGKETQNRKRPEGPPPNIAMGTYKVDAFKVKK